MGAPGNPPPSGVGAVGAKKIIAAGWKAVK